MNCKNKWWNLHNLSVYRLSDCIPVRIGEADVTAGPRLGGRRPRLPVREPGKYFLTVPLLGSDRFVSVFVTEGDALVGGHGRLHGPGLVTFVVHDESVARAQDAGAGDSSLSGHGLVIGDVRPDLASDDDGAPWSGHKFGGRPYIVNRGEEIEAEVDSCLNRGFAQIVQMDFPGNAGDAAVRGAWPFVTGMFHVLAAGDGAGLEFRWFFEL